MKTSELISPALNWAVAKCEGVEFTDEAKPYAHELMHFNYSTDWAQGGPIIEREGIDVLRDGNHWTALKTMTIDHPHLRVSGPTPLVAAMRCFVASKFGDDVEIPEGL